MKGCSLTTLLFSYWSSAVERNADSAYCGVWWVELERELRGLRLAAAELQANHLLSTEEGERERERERERGRERRGREKVKESNYHFWCRKSKFTYMYTYIYVDYTYTCKSTV